MQRSGRRQIQTLPADAWQAIHARFQVSGLNAGWDKRTSRMEVLFLVGLCGYQNNAQINEDRDTLRRRMCSTSRGPLFPLRNRVRFVARFRFWFVLGSYGPLEEHCTCDWSNPTWEPGPLTLGAIRTPNQPFAFARGRCTLLVHLLIFQL